MELNKLENLIKYIPNSAGARTSGENIKLSLNDIIVNYDDNGPVYAPAVIFIHGFPLSKSMWDLQAETLKSNFRVLAYDMRGHGGSKGGNGNHSIDTLTNDLLSFMDSLELEKVIVCGMSLGGYVALNAVQKYPERFNALVLAGIKCEADTETEKKEKLAAGEFISEKGFDDYVDDSIRHLFASRSFLSRKEEVRAVRNMILGTSVASIRSTLEALANRNDLCGKLQTINLPVMILAGKEDFITPVWSAERLKDNIKGAELHVMDYAAHLANIENTHEFNNHLKRFVGKVCEKKHLSKHCS